ncbi:MAG: class I SAM-dependent methyltransferase [Betaproteobacteria bacterium]|nr:class I SAM-dependent methyltransferase [Betaproteobacteria bacterium]
MSAFVLLRRVFWALILSFVAVGSVAQNTRAQQFEPEVGQRGKDVIWIPTPQALVDRMLNLAEVTPKDYVVDLGSGDGRTVISAVKRGARALGVEYNPDMVALSRRRAAEEGVGDKARFINGDIFETDFSAATVVTLFLLPDLNIKLRPKILEMKPGTRVVSNSFTMAEWRADQIVTASRETGCDSYCTAYLWIVPTKVAGAWRMDGGELALKQEFQMISGSLKIGGKTTPVTGGRLRGDEIRFGAGGAVYTGRVRGDTIEGTVKSGIRVRLWKARRDVRS